jgi:hypothetical protein
LVVAFWVELGFAVEFELATGVAAVLAFFVAPAGVCASDVVVWAVPIVPLVRRAGNFAVG